MEHGDWKLAQKTFFAFDTVNTVQIYPDMNDVFDELKRLCSRFEKLFSHTDPDSELSRLNASRGEPVEVSAELAWLLKAALRYCAETEGLFDITMGSVVRLWDFKRGIVPSHTSVAEALTHVDYRGVFVDGERVRLRDPDSRVVLGGIAKGYIADALLHLLRSSGVTNAIVNLGGNVAVMGGKPDGTPFAIGLRNPVASKEGEVDCYAAVPLADGSVVTSGVYERSFEINGVRYHHILDPRTGFPAQTNLVSASVIAKDSLDADGLSTALVVMGLDRARAFIEARDGVEAVFTTAGGEAFATSGVLRLP